MVLKTVGAGLLSTPLILNGPGGHQLLHEVGLRVAFRRSNFRRRTGRSSDNF